MATETLRPNAAGDECNILNEIGADCPNHWQNVDEATPDESSTIVYTHVAAYQRDLYNLPAHSGSGDINHVTVYCRCRRCNEQNQSCVKVACKTHSTVFEGAEETLATINVWENKSKQWTTNPYTGSAWTWSEIDAFQIGVALRTPHSEYTYSTRCTQVYVEVDYTPPATPKTSSDAGSGADAGATLSSAYSRSETGAGSESLGSRLLGAIEEGGGTEALLARLLAGAETASGLDAGGLIFTSSDVGSGLDAILALEALLTGADSGSGIDTAYLIKALLSTDSGLGTEAVAALLAGIVAGELMVGSDRLVVKIESAPMGGGMSLPPGGKTSIPSRRVNL